MPVVLHRNIDTNTQLAIWKMSEPLEKLLQSGVAIPKNIKSNKRQKEWVCSRLLLKQLTTNTEISYNQYGAPALSNGSAVSISHSHDYCAILVSKQTAAVDLEFISTKADRMKEQFIAKEEVELITKSEISTLIWCAKECLFKIHQKGNLIFKEDLIIKNIEESSINTSLKKTAYTLHFEKFKNHFLVYYFE
ncbi:MAG: hypothetical protein CMP75_02170 [Flavobacteriales bacterium]|nr:hypothetical protein [Flavobacteriales bacterium]|tara:strand:- start:130 stop:705 length:576 start_codon:yes stop_codon:yes gene_type:complete